MQILDLTYNFRSSGVAPIVVFSRPCSPLLKGCAHPNPRLHFSLKWDLIETAASLVSLQLKH